MHHMRYQSVVCTKPSQRHHLTNPGLLALIRDLDKAQHNLPSLNVSVGAGEGLLCCSEAHEQPAAQSKHSLPLQPPPAQAASVHILSK